MATGSREVQSFFVIPILGRKSDVPANDPRLLVSAGQNVAFSHAVGGLNVDYKKQAGSVSKSRGSVQWSNTAATTTLYCNGSFELWDGTNRDYIVFMVDGSANGRFFYADASRDFTRVHDGGGTPLEYAYQLTDYYEAIRYGSWIIFTDNLTTTPYKWKNGEANLTKLIDGSGTSGYVEYKCKFLANFQKRIVMAYDDKTNGDISIRWCDPLQALATGGNVEFSARNHLYRAHEDPITGIKPLNRDIMLVYGEDSIDRIDVYGDYKLPFGIINIVSGFGAVNNRCIVPVGQSHYFFNEHYGFCEYRGTAEFPYGGRPISEPINDMVSTINPSGHVNIQGIFKKDTHEIVWSVPLYGSDTPNALLFFDVVERQWRNESKDVRQLDSWEFSPTWTEIINLGYTTWQDLIDDYDTWSELSSSSKTLMMFRSNGHAYSYGGGTNDPAIDAGSFKGWREEPMMQFGRGESSLQEVWFSFAKNESTDMYVEYRSGATVGEVKNSQWESLGSISLNNPDPPKINVWKNKRLHQIRFGTPQHESPFSVNKIEYRFTTEKP